MPSRTLIIVAVAFAVLLLNAGTGSAAELSLSEAIGLSLAHNFGVKAARFDSAASHYSYREAKSFRLPTISVKAHTRFIDDIPTFELPFMSIETGSRENYQLDMRLVLPLYTGGRISNRIKRAGVMELAKSAQLKAVYFKTAYNCRRLYLTTVLAESQLEIARTSMKRLKIIRSNVEDLYQQGLADSIDILEADLAIDEGSQLLFDQQTFMQNAKISLAYAVGKPEMNSLQLSGNMTLPKRRQKTINPREVEIKRSELKRFDHLIAAAGLSENIAHSEYMPQLTGSAGYSWGKPNLDFFEKEWNDYLSVGLELSWEFNFGKKTAMQYSASKQQTMATKMEKEKLRETLVIELEKAINELELAYELSAIARNKHNLAARKFRLAEEKQKEGGLTVNRLLEMEAELTATELRHRASLLRYYLAQSDSYFASGSSDIYGDLK